MSIHRQISIRGAKILLLAWLLTLPVSSGIGLAQGVSIEYQIKAAFLLNFTRYVEWPNRSGDLNICVLGPDVFGNVLNEVAAGKVVNGRKIVVRKSVSQSEASACDIVYLSLPPGRPIRDALRGLDQSGALTVGEDADFLRMGGMIAFAPVEGKVRFYINAAGAWRAGIKISSRLMVLGRNIRDEGERLR